MLSGPSGSGKTTICHKLAENPKVEVAVSATTRPKRPGEKDGEDYLFMTREEFETRIENNEFVEYNEVFGNNSLYGSLRREVERGLNKDDGFYLMEIDVVGALNLKKDDYQGRYIFIAPPSLKTLEERLLGRGTDDRKSIETRMKKAQWEMDQAVHYDLTVVNEDIDESVAQILRFLKLK